jgi:hypothetical protein
VELANIEISASGVIGIIRLRAEYKLGQVFSEFVGASIANSGDLGSKGQKASRSCTGANQPLVLLSYVVCLKQCPCPKSPL